LPAFLVPFVFVMDPLGVGLLLNIPKGGSWWDILWISGTTAVGIFGLGAAAQGWLIGKLAALERALLLIGGLLMVFSTLVAAILRSLIGLELAWPDAFGVAFIAAAVGLQLARRRTRAAES
jgi:TRAP-type uncharacterized transport system fused permease subunit